LPQPQARHVPKLCALALFAVRVANAHGMEAGRQVEFNRDVRPILADACFKCHGFDAAARKAGLRLDVPTSPSGCGRS
jgi:hypothetical protein